MGSGFRPEITSHIFLPRPDFPPGLSLGHTANVPN